MRKTHTEIHLRNEPEHGHKEYKYLYQQMLKDDVIRKAYKKLRKGKTKRKEIQYIDAQIVIYGKNGHAEVLGLVGQTHGKAIVIEKPELIAIPSCFR